MGVFQRFSSSPGAAGPTIILGPFTVPANNQITVTDWKGTLETGADDTLLQLEIEPLGGAFTEVDRIELPVAGTIQQENKSPIRITAGQRYQVRSTQGGTTGEHSTTLLGKTTSDDIADV